MLYDSIRPTTIPPTMAPGRDPKPPIISAAKARAWKMLRELLTRYTGASSQPAAPTISTTMQKVSMVVRLVGMPNRSAAYLFWAAADMILPQ